VINRRQLKHARSGVRKFIFAPSLLFVFAIAATPQPANAQQKEDAQSLRPLTPADLPKLESLGDGFGNVGVLSPDGKFFAYTIQRPKLGNFHQEPFLGGGERADIYVVPTAGGKPRNLTDGQHDGTGAWAPVWSPDSKRIAFASTRGPGQRNVHLWVCELDTGHTRQLTDGGIDLIGAHSFVWLSDHQIVAVALPEGRQPLSMTVEMQAGQTAIKQWEKSWKGDQATVTVLESGVKSEAAKHPQDDLILVDVRGEKTVPRTLLQAPGFSDLQASPSGKNIAVLQETEFASPTKGRLAWVGLGRYSVKIIDSEGHIAEPGWGKAKFILQNSLRWSSDGTELALAEDPSAAGEGGSAIFVCHMASGKCEQVGQGLQTAMSSGRSQDANPAPFAWSAHNALFLYAKKADGKRSDWWQVSPNPEPKNITEKFKDEQVPGSMIPEASGDSFVAVADGHVWRIAAAGGAPQDLTPQFTAKSESDSSKEKSSGSQEKISFIVWPAENTPDASGPSEIIFATAKNQTTSLFRLSLNNGEVKPIAKPADFATLSARSAKTGAQIFSGTSRTGDSLWLSEKDNPEKFTEVVHLNAFLQTVAQGSMKLIDYQSLDGKPLKAWLMFPTNYHEGVKFPMVTWVYAGSMMSEAKEPFLSRLDDPIALNMQIFASHGYGALFPSMPLSPEGVTSDPLLDLSNGVLPAVDKVVAMGLADSDRVGLMGQSFGGFSTYGLITQTHRFKAAAALAGLSDLFSLYGQFDARLRYTEFPHEDVFMMWLFENGQARVGSPPWEDLGRYLRNSPIFYVERVETPLLIIQGDMDYVAMQQGEEFFNALYRQGKRAEFVRYWGEGHVLESPANIADMWEKLFAWFDQFMQAPPDKPDSSANKTNSSD
jgi:dipeptidyl aminopeptidase/acylaminoacyl peptidase